MLVALLFVLGLGTVLLAVAALAMRRQLQSGRAALAPLGSVPTVGGESTCEPAPIVSAMNLAGEILTIGGSGRNAQPQLLVFVEAQSPLCEAVVADAWELCRNFRVRLLILGEGRSDDFAELVQRHSLPKSDVILNAALGEDFQIGPVPSAALVGGCGRILSRGTVQRREQLEKLLKSVKR